MTTEEIRNARKSFAAQLTAMIKDFERQTGIEIQGINVERETFKGCNYKRSLFKGVFIALDK